MTFRFGALVFLQLVWFFLIFELNFCQINSTLTTYVHNEQQNQSIDNNTIGR